MGDTKQGKSTIFNLLIGNQLESFFNHEIGRYDLRQLERKEPFIGDKDYRSETIVPYIHELKPEEVYTDNPGFKDSKGFIQEIINQHSLIKILKMSKVTRIVFVAAE